MTDLRRRGLLAIAFLTALPCALFLDVLLGRAVFHVRDVSLYHFPMKRVLREIVLRGEFPYWNAWTAAGQPLAANPAHEVFYPLTWLILLPDYVHGFQLLALVHVPIALLATWALLRSMGISRTSATVGALSFGLGGFVLSGLHLFPFLFSAAWMPLTFLFGRRAILDRRMRDFALSAFFLGVQCLVGEPVVLIQTGLVLGIYAIGVAPKQQRFASIGKNLAIVAAIGVAALAVAAVQILPAIDHARDSVRSAGFRFDLVSEWSTPPARLAELFFPDLFGSFLANEPDGSWGGAMYRDRAFPFFPTIYGGLMTTLLAVAGVLAAVRGRGIYLAITAISILLSLGDHTPLLRVLYELGLVSSIRYPEKFLIMGLFATAVFGAIALDRLLEKNASMLRMVRGIAVALLVVAIAGVGSTLMPDASRWFRRLWSIDAQTDVSSMLQLARAGWVIAAVRLSAALAIFALVRRVPRIAASLLLIGFAALDVSSRVEDAVPRTTRSFYEAPPPAIAQLPLERDDFRVFLIASVTKSRNSAEYFVRRAHRELIQRNALDGATPASYGIRTVMEGDYDLTSLRNTNDFAVSMWELGEESGTWLNYATAMSNVWYVGLYRPFDEALADARGDARVLQPVNWVAGLRYPRYYFAGNVVSHGDREDFVRKLASGRHSRQDAFVAGESGFTPAAGRVVSAEEQANSATLEVETSGLAFLVMSVTGHKYWRITIDGVDVDAIATNVGYQGIPVPPGRHTIRMRYHNPLIAAGAAISAAALLALAAFAIRRRAPALTPHPPLPAA